MTEVVQVKKRSQVTIPKKAREKLGIKEGDILEVAIEKDALVLQPRPSDKTTVRTTAAASLKRLSGIIAVGGDALKESETPYED